MLKGKHIILAVTGGIAAYKAAYLLRLFVKEGAQVQILMSDTAKKFVSPLTFATLSGRPVLTEFFDPENGQWNSHVELGIWADCMLVAPATANTMAKMAHGIADNLLLTTYLSARCPVHIAPAMDLDMWKHPATQANLDILKQRGVEIIEPASGELASGLQGKGRMAEPEAILAHLQFYLAKGSQLAGRTILVTAGPTFEPIDSVRFIGNFSSGKMGYAIAEAFAERGAQVILISGPVALNPTHPGITRIGVTSAAQMLETCIQHWPSCHGAVLCAAVADYTPLHTIGGKLKRKDEELTISLKKTQDIAATLGASKQNHQVLAGFALEAENEFQNAREKLRKKNLNFIVLNSLNQPGAGFMHDTNRITIIPAQGEMREYPLKAKPQVAADIVDYFTGCAADFWDFGLSSS